MPLVKGKSKKAISENIRELSDRNKKLLEEGKRPRPRKQIIAIALSEAKKNKKR
jgi:hypothetical protein